jgi:Tfp pilus assembly protein PilN
MGGFGLNLSTRPFPAYRAANLGLTAVLFVLIGVSAWQASSYLRYTKAAAQIRSAESTARAEAGAFSSKAQQLQSKLDTPAAKAKLTEIDYLNNLIARKNFSWTRVWSTLEQMIPEAVHLTSLRPDITEDGQILLHLDVRGRSVQDVSDFIEVLEKSHVFRNVIPHFEEKKAEAAGKVVVESPDVDVSLTMTYIPEKELQ